jgi:hypothetical protein
LKRTVLFSGFSDNIEDYLGVMNWDDFGTWYIYLFPNELKIDDPLCIGLSTFLPKSKGMDLVDYHYLGREW